MFKQIVYVSTACMMLLSCNHTEEQKNTVAKKDSLAAPANGSQCDTYLAQAKASDLILMRALVLDKTVASKAIADFNTYASNCKNDSLAPVFLFKAGQVAHAIGNFTQAQAMLNKCLNEYSDFKNRGAVLFLLAQIYDDPKMLNNEEEAKKLYEQIIKEYPKTPYAADSKSAIQNLGKTDEQLVQEFLKKNK